MAKIFPSNALDGWPACRAAMSFGEAEELNVLARLKKELPEHFSVFHSVQWNLRQGKFLHARETDFVVVNSNGRLPLDRAEDGSVG